MAFRVCVCESISEMGVHEQISRGLDEQRERPQNKARVLALRLHLLDSFWGQTNQNDPPGLFFSFLSFFISSSLLCYEIFCL